MEILEYCDRFTLVNLLSCDRFVIQVVIYISGNTVHHSCHSHIMCQTLCGWTHRQSASDTIDIHKSSGCILFGFCSRHTVWESYHVLAVRYAEVAWSFWQIWIIQFREFRCQFICYRVFQPLDSRRIYFSCHGQAVLLPHRRPVCVRHTRRHTYTKPLSVIPCHQPSCNLLYSFHRYRTFIPG